MVLRGQIEGASRSRGTELPLGIRVCLLPDPEQVLMKIRLRGRESRCPLCRVRHSAEHAETYVCSGCEVRYHSDCADELGGCSTLGCPRLGLGPQAETPAEEKRSERLRRGLRASRARRGERGRLASEHRSERAQAGERSSFLKDGALDVGLDAGCCCALGILELVLAGVLVGALLFPPGVKVAHTPGGTAAPAAPVQAPLVPQRRD